MENKLDILTKKLYEEGVSKARLEAEEILSNAQKEAAKIVADAQNRAEQMYASATADVENLKKKAASEMGLSTRQAITALKQAITNMISGKVAQEMARVGFEEKAYIQELLMTIVKKWDVSTGNLDLEVILSPEEKEQFEAFVASKYKQLLEDGLIVKAGPMEEGFIIQPKGGGYQIAFSEELFEAFFNQYTRGFTKKLLFQEEKL